MIYDLAYWPCFFLFRLVVRLRVHGGQHMPATGGVLLIANHLSSADPPLIAVSVRHPLHFMAKSELMSPAWWGWVLRQLHTFAIRRGEADRAALRQAEDLLARGHVVALFPEGHRSPTATLQRPHEGAVFLARRSKAPILPVAITGTEHITLRALWRRPVVHVTIGAPFRLDTLGPDLRRQAPEIMMEHIAALLPPSYRGPFDPSPP
jgi:1-acyl-sn-glycerol-3-phosphate acyltransferase